MAGRLFKAIRIAVCLIIILGVFYLYLPAHENRIYTMNETVGRDRIDILCVGSSHMFCGLNPIQMYKDHGYAAYIVGCGSQAPWQSYYYIKESCKYQNPKIVIIDVYMMGTRNETEYEDYQTVANLLDEPLSVDKIAAVNASVADSRLEIVLRFPYIYDEYESFCGFSRNKFYGIDDNYMMGYVYDDSIDTAELKNKELEDVSKIVEIEPISTKNELYLRKMIEYCRNNGMKVILVNAPWPFIYDEVQRRYNYIGNVAAEYGVPFIDGNAHASKVGIDWYADLRGNGGHLNNSGVRKFTDYVESFICENYDLPDRRVDMDYMSYDMGLKLMGELSAVKGN